MASELMQNFQGMPMKELIGAPLKAACDAQLNLAQASFEFITKIAFKDGKPGGETNIVQFNLQRPVETPNGIEKSDITVQAPFLGLVPTPSLLIDDVNIDFQMEVNAATSSKDTHSSDVSTDAHASFSFGWFGKGSVDIHGKVTSARENTRSTNQTAKYNVRVSARQQQPTEGLSRLMDIMASCTAPLKVSGGQGA